MAAKNRSLSLRRKEEELADMEAKTQQIRDWIEGLLKEKLPKVSFRDALLDGVVLCKLANAIKAGCIKKFHKKPRMLMMKMENIAFFLTACKSRFNIPQAVIFAPTDIHDDTDPTSMRKVINVLLLMKQEIGGGPSAAEAAKQLEEEERKREEEMDQLVAADVAAGIITPPAPKKPAAAPAPPPEEVVENPPLSDDEGDKEAKEEPKHEKYASEEQSKPEEPEIEPEPPKVVPKVEPKVEPKVTPKPEPAKPSAHVTSNSASHTNGSALAPENDWYLKGKPAHDHGEVQGKVLTQIVGVIDQELCLEAKLQLIQQLQNHISAVNHKVMTATNEELRVLAHEMGLGHSLTEVPQKDRQWYIDFILKHGRAQ